MRKHRGHRARLAVMLIVSAVIAVRAQDRSAIIGAFQQALNAGDRDAVMRLLHYPLAVSFDGVRVPFATPASVIERYDEIFTRELRGQINDAITTGIVAGELKITAIRVPRSEAPTTPEGEPAPAIPRTPRRIAVRAGPRPSRIAGLLAAGSVDSFLLHVQKGQFVQVSIERGRAEARIRMVHAASGVPLNPKLSDNAVAAAGRASEGGDYRIDVRHTGPGNEALPYLLVVSTRQ